MRRYLLKISGRDQMESVAGMKWNQWPRSNGIGGRDQMESVAGIIWNLHPVNLIDPMGLKVGD